MPSSSSSTHHHDHDEKSHNGTIVETKVNEDDDVSCEPEEKKTILALQTWLQQQHPTSIATIVQPDYWPPRNTQLKHYYDWSLPTHEVYKYCYCSRRHSKESESRMMEDDDDGTEEIGDASHDNDATATIIENMCNTNYLNDTIDTKRDDDEKEGEKKVDDRNIIFTPTFCEARSKLDYTYHTHVVKQRQYLQDAIIQRIVSTTTNANWNHPTTNNNSQQKSVVISVTDHILHHTNKDTDHVSEQSSHRPWIVFTAGPMGVGKGYVITQLQQLQLFNVRDHFITIDPDLIKYEIPEMVGYLQIDRNTAATKVHRESTQISDIIFEYAILHSLSILVDGSLRDVNYYQSLFHRIRKEYPQYRIGIIHITASREVIFERATSRAIRTGRVIPKELLEESIEQVPKSVALLSPLADAVHVIANHPNRPIQLVSSTIRQMKTALPQSFHADTNNESNHTSQHNEQDIVTTTTSWKVFKESWDLPHVVNVPIPNENDKNIAPTYNNSNTNGDHIIRIVEAEAPNVISKMDDLPDATNLTAESSVESDTSPLPSSLLQPIPTDSREKQKVLHNSISMSHFMDDHSTHVVANAIWQKSYPNFCARCALVTDEQCGICIHNVHICACSICSDHPTCLKSTRNNVNGV